MSYKFDSLIRILKKLDSKERVTLHSIMDDLEISERTAYRYLQTLQVAGFPIYFDRRSECYIFTENFSLGKPDVSLEESLALALSKQLLSNLGTGMEKSLNSIEKKLSITEQALPGHLILQADKLPSLLEDRLTTIYGAVKNMQRIKITYRSLYADETTRRKVDPYYLFHRDDFWYLRGYCHLREELRTFALDRMESIQVLTQYFIAEGPSPEDELNGAFGSAIDGEPAEVILRFSKDAKPYICRKKWHGSQTAKELSDGRLEVTFQINGTVGIKHWIYRWLPHVEIVSPKAFRAEMVNDLNSAMKMHK